MRTERFSGRAPAWVLSIVAVCLAFGAVSARAQEVCTAIGGSCQDVVSGEPSTCLLGSSVYSASCPSSGVSQVCCLPDECVARSAADAVCLPGRVTCPAGSTSLGDGGCDSSPGGGACCTQPSTGPTCGQLLGDQPGQCLQVPNYCPTGYTYLGSTSDCRSCCDAVNGPPPPPPPSGSGTSTYRVEYLHTDALGSVRMVTDQAGAVLARRDYYPFGGEIEADKNGREDVEGYTAVDPDARQRFTGKERDAESALDYFGARYYSGAQGRFTTADLPFADQAVTDPQSWNLYSYTRNNPLKYVDEDGRGLIGVAIKLARAGYKGYDLYSSVSGAVEATETIFSGDASIGTGARLMATVALLGEVSGVSDVLPSSGTRKAVGEVASHIDDVGDARRAADGVTHQTYTKTNPETGAVYSGKTSGTGNPFQNVARRDSGHHMTDKGFGPVVLDKSSSNPAAIRGREQNLIDKHGGAQSRGGTSGNAINSISDRNRKKDCYLGAACKESGEK